MDEQHNHLELSVASAVDERCPECGAPISIEDVFCPDCGQPIAPVPDPDAEERRADQSRVGRPVVLLLLAFAAILAVTGVVVVGGVMLLLRRLGAL